MAARCQVTGRSKGFGHNVSHSHVRTKRQFKVNLQSKTYWVPSLGRKVTLRLSPAGMRVIDRRGIDSVVAQLLARGERL